MSQISLKMPRPAIHFRALIWALPALVLVIVNDVALHAGIGVPLPFILLFATVVLAGSLGGLWAGLAAGLITSVEIWHAFHIGVGPNELTGGPLQAFLGCVVFTFIGGILGWLKDRSDYAIAGLKQAELALVDSVKATSAARDREAAKVSEKDEQLRHAMRLSGIGFFKWNAQTGDCEFCSEQHAGHFGLSPQEFQILSCGTAPFIDYVHDDDKEAFLEAVARVDQGESLPFDYRIVRPDGQIRYIRQINEPIFDDGGKEIAVVGSSLDFTDLHHSEVQLRRSQRIEAIGNLTGGVAHDFNNLLAVILGNLEMSLITDDPEARNEMIRAACKATHRGADLTKSLLSFARRAHLTPSQINLNQLLDTTVVWASRVLPESISIETSLFAGLWETKLDAASMENAIINLLLNARDAMPDGGKLTLETANMRIGDEHISDGEEDIEPGRYVMLAISDTGHGIAEDKRDQIFEPFYTEKPIGEGTGLGLSMVHGFIKQSEGAIRVSSEVNLGTTFKLYFKAMEPKAAP